jgi:outer membrane protein TolC
MVNLAAARVQVSMRFFRKVSFLALVVLWMLVPVLLGWPVLAFSTESRPPTTPTESLKGPADFDACVQLALRQSPFFTKSALEIEVRRLNEKDSKSDFFPSFTGAARYYLAQPKNPLVDNPLTYSYGVSTGNYNPLFAYLSLKANHVITQIATLAHLKVISAGLERLGKAFLELDSVENLVKLRAQSMELARENLRYARERQKLGEITPLEVQIASQEAEVATAEQAALIASKSRLLAAIKDFLGLPSDQPLQLRMAQVRRQVLGDFEPQKATLKDAESRSFDIRIKKLTQELQSWNVTLAKVKFVPSLNMAVQSPDPLSETGVRGTFFSMGLSFPIFDGFKKVRNINRQKKILNQYASEETVKTDELSQKWREVEENLKNVASALRVAQARAELARLQESQGETVYKSAEKDFSVLMAARQNRVKAQMDAMKQALVYDEAVLELRALSGDLVYHYVQESQFQK